MNRRDFLRHSVAGLAAAAIVPDQISRATTPAPAQPHEQFDQYFHRILHGFYDNALATSQTRAVCDFPDGTKLASCCTPSGKTYVSVARMLPAMADWLAAGRPVSVVRLDGTEIDMRAVLRSIYVNAFNPGYAHFWGYAPSDRATQRSVEAALVAISLVRLGERFVGSLSSTDRANIQKWLASCTQVPERKTNHAWFTACNQAARLELSRTYKEFQGDEAWMLADLEAMDSLAAKGTTEDGWYTDSPDQPIYDVYNFYVFPNFPLMWGQIIGARYGEWHEKFRGRIRKFLERTPYFFAGNGGHPLMGRSLIYRWAVLSPLVLGYREGLWPHSPGLLRRIVRKQFEYHWSLGCFDERRGKLRETYTADETPVTREPYVDNGHPYWAMLGFAFLGIPKDDPFWTAPEEELPVEKRDFVQKFDGPKFILSGTKRTGEVKWLMSQNAAKRDAYRDKYSKFSWSSHFGFNATDAKAAPPADQALVFRRVADGVCATRAPAGVTEGKLLDGGVETKWFATLGDWRFDVVSRVRLSGEYEERTHSITAPAEALGNVEIVEGSYVDGRLWTVQGYDRVEPVTLENANLLQAKVSFQQAVGRLTQRETTVAVIAYASPKPLDARAVALKGEELKRAWKPGD